MVAAVERAVARLVRLTQAPVVVEVEVEPTQLSPILRRPLAVWSLTPLEQQQLQEFPLA